MDQLSRRDTVYQQLGQITDAIRQGNQEGRAAAATGPSSSISGLSSSINGGSLPIQQANTNINRYIDRVSGQLQNAINSQGSGVNSQRAPAAAASIYAARGPVSANPSYEALPASGAAGGGETLPDYAPPQVSQPITYLHSLKSTTGKLELLLESVGSKQYPVYVQNVCSTVAGRVCLRTQGDETITEVRLRVKGVVTTAVVRGNQNAHNRVLAEEEEFWYSSSLLWSSTQPGSALDPSKESHEFPFSIKIPDIAPPTPRIRKESPMPPSFILQPGATYVNGGIEIATIRYYVKVTLARKGLLRPNERLFAPIVFLTREKDLSFLSMARRQALAQSIPLPGPTQAPDAWQGKVEEKTYKSGFFTSKKASFKVTLLLPTPLIYGKIESIPYYIRISSSDQATLDKLGDSSFLSVNLMQRCCIVSQGSYGSQDNIMSKSQAEEVTASELSANSAEPARRFKGVIDIKMAVGSAVSFTSLNLEVSFWVVCYSMEKGLVRDTLAAIPVKIVSIPPAARPAQNTAQGQAAPAVPASEMDDLPPAYFDVVEARQGGARAEKN